MLWTLLSAMFAPQMASSVALSPDTGRSAAASTGMRTELFRVVRSFEESGARSRLASNATLELLDLPRSDLGRKRLWRDVPGPGVISRYHMLSMKIVGAGFDRATVDTETRATVVEYGEAGDLRPVEEPRTIFDRIELVRTGDGWLIASVARRIR